MYVYVCVKHIYIYIMCICICVYIYIYICTHICIYTYITTCYSNSSTYKSPTGATIEEKQASTAGQRLLSGVPPLSAILNGAVPIVELETERLTGILYHMIFYYII